MSECAKCSCYQRADLSNLTDQISEPFTCSECGEKFVMDDKQLIEFSESQKPVENVISMNKFKKKKEDDKAMLKLLKEAQKIKW